VKKAIATLLVTVLLALSFVGCAHDKLINGVKYEPYGVVNEPDRASPEVEYRPAWFNIAIGIVFFNFIIPPLYVVGWELFEPVGPAPCPVYRASCEIPE